MIEYIWGGVTTAILGWIAVGIRNNRKENIAFKDEERGKREKFEDKIDQDFLREDKHKLLCENASLTMTKNIREHFDKKFKEYADELKKAIKSNGSKHQ